MICFSECNISPSHMGTPGDPLEQNLWFDTATFYHSCSWVKRAPYMASILDFVWKAADCRKSRKSRKILRHLRLLRLLRHFAAFTFADFAALTAFTSFAAFTAFAAFTVFAAFAAFCGFSDKVQDTGQNWRAQKQNFGFFGPRPDTPPGRQRISSDKKYYFSKILFLKGHPIELVFSISPCVLMLS